MIRRGGYGGAQPAEACWGEVAIIWVCVVIPALALRAFSWLLGRQFVLGGDR